jgi:hypothetical protein
VLRKIGTPTQLSTIAHAVDAYCERYEIKDTQHREQLAMHVRQRLQWGAIKGEDVNTGVVGNVIAFAMNEGIPIDLL